MRAAVGIILATLTACALPGGTARLAQTHFVDPGQTLTRLGTAQARVKKLCGVFLINWGVPDAEMMQAAVDAAIATQPGADLLIDAQTDASIYMVPLLFSRCRVQVSGTAATVAPAGKDDHAPP